MLININEKLTKNFTLSEFLNSKTANQKGLKLIDYLDEEKYNNIKKVAEVLQIIRDRYNNPIHISSGLRSPELNILVGGVQNSKHLVGLAADLSGVNRALIRKLWSCVRKCKKVDLLHSYYKETEKSAYIHLQIINA